MLNAHVFNAHTHIRRDMINKCVDCECNFALSGYIQ